MSDRDSIGKMIFVTSGLLVWAIHFTVIYGFATVACVKGFATANVFGIGVVESVIGAVTLLALAAAGMVLRIALASPVPTHFVGFGDATEHFLRYTAAAVAVLSLVAIAWNAVPVLIVPPC